MRRPTCERMSVLSLHWSTLPMRPRAAMRATLWILDACHDRLGEHPSLHHPEWPVVEIGYPFGQRLGDP